MRYTADDKMWMVPLDRYERDNLVSLLNAIGYGARGIAPFTAFNTGDWIGQIALKLSRLDGSHSIDEKDRPNVALEEMKRQMGEYDDAKRLHAELMMTVRKHFDRQEARRAPQNNA